MTKYRVVRREYVRRRPKWMERFLLALSPELYGEKDSREAANEVLLTIKNVIIDTGLLARKKRLHIEMDEDHLALVSIIERTFISFTIETIDH